MKLIDTPIDVEDLSRRLYLNSWYTRVSYRGPVVNVHWRTYVTYPAAEKWGNVLGGLTGLPLEPSATWEEFGLIG